MPKVVYPNGNKVYFMWIDDKYGYFRRNGRVLRFPLPRE